MNIFSQQLKREWLLFLRQPNVILNATVFFVMISSFFPVTMPADAQLMRQIAPGLVWVSVLLAMLLASERLFQQDFEDGVMEQWVISGHSLAVIITAKIIVHWVLTIFPLLLFCPFLALFFNLSIQELSILLTSLLLGSPFVLGLCVLAAAFSIGMQQKGAFMALILLPLTIPALIFGSGAVTAGMEGLPVSGYFAILAALSIAAMALLPITIEKLIRIILDD